MTVGPTIPGDEAMETAPEVRADYRAGIDAMDDQEDAELMAEVQKRIEYLSSPDYDDPSLRCLTRRDWMYWMVVAVIVPIILIIWGAFMI
jgi:hypothetical protein